VASAPPIAASAPANRQAGGEEPAEHHHHDHQAGRQRHGLAGAQVDLRLVQHLGDDLLDPAIITSVPGSAAPAGAAGC